MMMTKHHAFLDNNVYISSTLKYQDIFSLYLECFFSLINFKVFSTARHIHKTNYKRKQKELKCSVDAAIDFFLLSRCFLKKWAATHSLDSLNDFIATDLHLLT